MSGQPTNGSRPTSLITTAKLERVVLKALREHLYTPGNLKQLIAHVRDELLAKAKQEARPVASDEVRAKQVREVEREIEHIKTAVRMEKATETLLAMLEDAERRRKSLEGTQEVPGRAVDVQA